MSKSLNELLGIKDIHLMSTEELSNLAQDIAEADEREELEYARNNSLSNDILDQMFRRGDLAPHDAVEIACMMIVKMILGNAKTGKEAGEMLSGCIGRMVEMIAKNAHQINSSTALFKSHEVNGGKIGKKKDIQ